MLVIGGGAAGMMAAITAAKEGANVTLLERNDKIGRKLYITGKGRCNLTNYTFGQDFMSNIVGNARFLYSALAQFDAQSTYDFFEDAGVPLKVERGQRVFPISDRSADIIDALFSLSRRLGVQMRLGVRVTGIRQTDDGYMLTTDQGVFIDRTVVVATGGISYPATGSTGDGYALARSLCLSLVPPVPALVGIRCAGTQAYSGLSLRNVRLSVMQGDSVLYQAFGEMLYTHTGISGPIVLSASSYINRVAGPMVACVDLKPALTIEQLDERLLGDMGANANKLLRNTVDRYLPKALVSDWLSRSGVDGDKVCNSVTKDERLSLAKTIKAFCYPILGLEPIEEAVVTAGGIDVREIDPKTMESKRYKGLYWAGEVLDVDALTGGFNLQLAFSTGFCAGKAAAAKERDLC